MTELPRLTIVGELLETILNSSARSVTAEEVHDFRRGGPRVGRDARFGHDARTDCTGVKLYG